MRAAQDGGHRREQVLRCTPEAPKAARTMVRRAAPGHSRLEDAVLATSELVTNAVRHSDAEEAKVAVVVDEDARLRVEVEHPGNGFFPPPPADPTVPEGRGLRIVEAVADRFRVEGGDRTVVWFEMDGATAHGERPDGDGAC